MDRELKLFSTQIETWGSPLLIRASDENEAEELSRILFKIPSDVGITATRAPLQPGTKMVLALENETKDLENDTESLENDTKGLENETKGKL